MLALQHLKISSSTCRARCPKIGFMQNALSCTMHLSAALSWVKPGMQAVWKLHCSWDRSFNGSMAAMPTTCTSAAVKLANLHGESHCTLLSIEATVQKGDKALQIEDSIAHLQMVNASKGLNAGSAIKMSCWPAIYQNLVAGNNTELPSARARKQTQGPP